MGGFGLEGIGALLSGGSVAGATTGASGGNAAVWGKKPKVAAYTPTDLTAEEAKSLQGNLSNADSIEALLNRLVPGWSQNLAQGTKNAGSLLRGEIPQDVQDQIQRSSAYKALSGGFGGSGMSHALTARDLGRTSLDLQQVGQNSAQQWAHTAQQAYSPWLSSGAEMAGNTRANNAGIQAQQQQQFNVNAAPDPAAAGKFAIDSAIGMQLLNVGTGFLGGIGGGGSGSVPAPAQAQYNSGYQFNPATGQYVASPYYGGAYGGGK